MKRVALLTACFVAAAAIGGFAAEEASYSLDVATGTVTVSGAADVTGSNETDVTIHVLRPGKTYENSDPNTFDAVAFASQTTTVQGEYSFKFQLENSGVYTASIGGVGDKAAPLQISFVNGVENKAAINDLNAAAKVSYDKFAEVLGLNKNALGFTLPLFNDVSQSTVMQQLYAKVTQNDLDPDDGTAAIKLFEQLTVIEGLNEGKVKSVNPYKKSMNITTGPVKDWYAKSIVTEQLKSAATARISGKGISTLDEFSSLFQQALILEIVKQPGSSANIKLLLEDYAADIGINTSGVSDNAYLALSGQNYTDYAQLKNAFNSAVSAYAGGSGGGGGGGGGSSSGGAKGSSVTLPMSGSNAAAAPSVPTAQKFNDLADKQWAQQAILALAEKGMVSGKTANTFAPDDEITREELVKLLTMLFDIKSQNTKTPFTDVKETDWFCPYVAAAYENGLCKGISETEFGAGLPVKRQDIAVMAANALAAQKTSLTQQREPAEFADAADISGYALESVNLLYGAKILSGNEKQQFLPLCSATRAEAAVIIYNLTRYAGQEG